MSGLRDYQLGGLTPPIDYTTQQTALSGTVPRIVVDTIWLYKYADGKLEPLGNGQGVNAFTGGTVPTS